MITRVERKEWRRKMGDGDEGDSHIIIILYILCEHLGSALDKQIIGAFINTSICYRYIYFYPSS